MNIPNAHKKGLTWQQIVPALLAAIIIVVMVVLIGKGAKTGTSIYECTTQGGVCADTIGGNTGGTTCPAQADGYRWITLNAKCKKNNQEYACCQQATPVQQPGQQPQQPVAVNTTPQQPSPEQVQRREAQATAEVAAEHLTAGRERDDNGELLLAYDAAKTVIADNFLLFSRVPNKEPEVATPLGYTSIKSFETITILIEYLRSRERIENPYPAMCKIWAIMFRGYAEGYWRDSQYDMASFHQEISRRLNEHSRDAQSPYCEHLRGMGDVTIIKNCMNTIDFQRAEDEAILPPSYQQFNEDTLRECQKLLPLFQDASLDIKQPGFSIEPFFTDLNAVLEPLRAAEIRNE